VNLIEAHTRNSPWRTELSSSIAACHKLELVKIVNEPSSHRYYPPYLGLFTSITTP
jgi:hypothetical protein